MMNEKSTVSSLLEEFVQDNTQYVLGVGCVGNDGILVDAYVRNDVQPEHAGIISATLFNFVNRIAKTLQMGAMQEMSMRSDNGYVLIMPIDANQTLVVLLNSETNMGIMQFELRSLIQHLVEA